jgi:hypothetical protein
MRTNENAFHIPRTAFLQQRGPDVFAYVVPHQEKRDPIPTTKIHEGNPNLGPRRHGENITPMGSHIEIGLPISELRISRFERVGANGFSNSSMMEKPDFSFADTRSLTFDPTPRGEKWLNSSFPRGKLRSWSR